jgi:hypothetical protein
VCLIIAWKSPGKAFSGLATDVTLQDFERSRRLLRTRKRN